MVGRGGVGAEGSARTSPNAVRLYVCTYMHTKKHDGLNVRSTTLHLNQWDQWVIDKEAKSFTTTNLPRLPFFPLGSYSTLTACKPTSWRVPIQLC